MYDPFEDPYCYKGTFVLKNRKGFRTQAELEKFEALSVALRRREGLPPGKLDVGHYRAIHRHLFQDVYSWAGKIRKVEVSKGGNPFCATRFIEAQLNKLFEHLEAENHFRDIDAPSFAQKAAHFLSELNVIHPFREGNGRTQNRFLVMLADQAGHPLELARLDPPDEMREAMIAAFHGNEQTLANLISRLMRRR